MQIGFILFCIGLLIVIVPAIRAVFVLLTELFEFSPWLGIFVIGAVFMFVGVCLK